MLSAWWFPFWFPLWLGAASPSDDYAGAAACRRCHAAEFAAQSASAHTRALARAVPPQPGDWAFGAGTQAITFVRRLDPEYYLEEGESWYRALGGYSRTPGHLTSAGVRDRIFDPSAAILRCFACHSTGPLDISGDHGIEPKELGVRCEVCHGPAADHVRQPKKFHPQNPGRFTADELNRFCGECHRAPAAAGESPILRDPWNARHQPFMLAASTCFRRSKGRLSCLTCHSPHDALERNLAIYDGACSRCHAATRHKLPTAGRTCVECHMPAVAAQAYLKFANHRIGVYAPTDPLVPVSASR